MAKNVVIVESPTKAKTIGRFLGRDYVVTASMGHIRDLPKMEMGVRLADASFRPVYVVPKDKKPLVKELSATLKDADAVYLATDPDREGEAIAWHLVQATGLDGLPNGKLVQRVVFHEITEPAIREAFQHPRDINAALVDAQQARRILDRIVGYELSPFLGKKIRWGLSAGRVQSAALRIIVDREREIQA
ncbi:MAG: DNA topoisomerase I, partial [Chloroflexi bacterium]|nr:DNA topoisomerase I [Chloroflexota bacterium]